MIAIVDYGVGNICSVRNALARAGIAEPLYTSDKAVLAAADKVILPGVGDAAEAMNALRSRSLDELIPKLRQPVLGICVGAQLMCSHSEEGDVDCMGIFDTLVRRFPAESGLKVPHIGWNRISGLKSPLFAGLSDGEYVYYVHSFYPSLCRDTVAATSYGVEFSGALAHDNFYACQFHPEKSGDVGARIIDNFLKL